MKITVKKVISYEVTKGDVHLGEFKKGTTWNGMTELTQGSYKIIVADPLQDNPFTFMFKDDDKAQDVEVVSSSPSLIPTE